MVLVSESLNNLHNGITKLTRQALKIKKVNDTNGFVVLDQNHELILKN